MLLQWIFYVSNKSCYSKFSVRSPIRSSMVLLNLKILLTYSCISWLAFNYVRMCCENFETEDDLIPLLYRFPCIWTLPHIAASGPYSSNLTTISSFISHHFNRNQNNIHPNLNEFGVQPYPRIFLAPGFPEHLPAERP